MNLCYKFIFIIYIYKYTIYIYIYVCKLVRVKERAIIVTIFVYLDGTLFVSLQTYMGKTNHCLNKLNCLTLPNSWFGGDGVYQL